MDLISWKFPLDKVLTFFVKNGFEATFGYSKISFEKIPLQELLTQN